MPNSLAKHELILLKTVQETSEIKSFYFDFGNGKFDYKPGQVLNIILDPLRPLELSREFSIASSPTENFILITMRMLAKSDFKSYLNSLSIGARILAEGPYGEFTLPEDATCPLAFIAGGIGVTPFRGMMKYIADMGLPHSVTLLYSARTPEEILYKNDWETFRKTRKDFSAIFTITRPEQSSSGWEGRVGRIDRALIEETVGSLYEKIIYLCGTPEMVRAMMKLLVGMGVPPERLKVESFSGYRGED